MNFKTETVEERFKEVSPALKAICHAMDAFCARHEREFTITESMTTAEEDKALNRVSTSHQEGRAVDIRTLNWSDSFIDFFIKHFAEGFGTFGALTPKGERKLLVYHDSGHGAHIHVQLDKTFAVEVPND